MLHTPVRVPKLNIQEIRTSSDYVFLIFLRKKAALSLHSSNRFVFILEKEAPQRYEYYLLFIM